jgi:hypothetical protein
MHPAVFAFVLCAGTTFADEPEIPKGWKELSPEGGKFTVYLPNKPTEQKKKEKLDQGPTDVFYFGIQRKEAADLGYVLVYYDLAKPKKEKATKEAYLQGLEKGTVQGVKGKLIDSSEISIGDHPGREVTFEGPGGVIARVRMFLVNERVYRLTVLGQDKEAVKSDAAKAYFGSFKLAK